MLRIFAAAAAFAIVGFLGSALINETDATGSHTHVASAAAPASDPAQAD